VARDLLVTHEGREIDKTDGFLMLFETADRAVAYAVAYHRALAELGIAARAGLHVGEVILTANSPADVARGAKPLEVDGIAKPTAARVMSIATGGQTLLTPAAVEALGETTLRLHSHGHWRMKGVSEPIELFEAGDEDAPFLPPPDGAKVYRVVSRGELWLPAKQVKNSLPAERDAFVGREADLREVARRLEGENRLVSVLGIGGTGKTRLVVRFGWTWLGDHPGGVYFCDLSEARTVEDIASAVARGMEVPLSTQDPVTQLGNAIAARGPCLMLLDNFEQVARFAEDTLGHWLDRAPEARFVVTTREVLGIPGEQTLALAPLPKTQGAALFVARARAAKRDFEPDDPASIDTLVELLDGLPLAIELAAARVRMMPVDKLLARMSERFRLLASGGRRQGRQATLRATLDWSWDMLVDDERAALAQLSVFEGGFTLDAAEAVLELEEAWPMDAVQALVDKSLVRQVSNERFGLLVSVQEYAAEKLGEDRPAAEHRHGMHFAGYGTREAIRPLDLRGGLALQRALGEELDNLVAASRRARRRGDGEVAILTALAAWQVFHLRGPMGAGVAVLEAVETVDAPPLLRARATSALCLALRFVGRIPDAMERYAKLLVTADELGDIELEVQARTGIGVLAHTLGRMDEATTTSAPSSCSSGRAIGRTRASCSETWPPCTPTSARPTRRSGPPRPPSRPTARSATGAMRGSRWSTWPTRRSASGTKPRPDCSSWRPSPPPATWGVVSSRGPCSPTCSTCSNRTSSTTMSARPW
jgi:predicted ATPase